MTVDIKIFPADSESLREQAFSVRVEVFCKEQNVPIENELDEYDNTCLHWVAIDETSPDKKPVGASRLVSIVSESYSTTTPAKPEPIAKIGRVAVLSEYRGLGIAKNLMQAMEAAYIKHNQSSLISKKAPAKFVLHAQLDKQGFYEKMGYQVVNPDMPPFYEEGILHVIMTKLAS